MSGLPVVFPARPRGWDRIMVVLNLAKRSSAPWLRSASGLFHAPSTRLSRAADARLVGYSVRAMSFMVVREDHGSACPLMRYGALIQGAFRSNDARRFHVLLGDEQFVSRSHAATARIWVWKIKNKFQKVPSGPRDPADVERANQEMQ